MRILAGIRSRTAPSARRLATGLVGVLALGLAGALPTSCIEKQAAYEVLIRRTDGGIPHIKAHDFASLGFGTGYAMAEDNICVLADQFLTFAAERSRFHGPAGGNLESDFFYRLFIDRADALQPVDPRQAALFRGAAAGYDRYLRDTGVANLSDPACQAAPWVREIADVDFRRISRMNFFYPFLLGQIVAARPPAVAAAASADGRSAPARMASGAKAPISGEQGREIEARLAQLLRPLASLGSNGIALGHEATVDGTGMLLANPHQPWAGARRFYAFHQTLPGELDVIGANVLGRPQVGLGATEHVAWTSTVQTGPLFTFYMLQLVPGHPTQYYFDGAPRDMIAETVSVEVPDGHGGFVTESHTFYSTHYGAMLVGGMFPWTGQIAFAVRAADVGWRGIEALMPQYQAKSVFDYKAVQDRYQFNATNQIAADSSGNAYYANTAPIPNLDDAQRAACALPGGFDGSRSECMWKTDPDAAGPGIFGPSRLPSQIRTDFESNMNDSYWLSNPFAPLVGFDSSLGSVGTPRSFRTRSGLAQIIARLEGTDGKGGSKFTLGNLQELITDNVAYTGRVLRDDLVALCQAHPSVTLDDGTVVDVRPACTVLANWDLTDGIDSHGAHLFREWAQASQEAERNYAIPFDAGDPVNTPRGLDTTDNPKVLQALAVAVRRLTAAGVPLDARLGDLQYVSRNGERIPIPGGTNASGLLNIIGAPFSASAGGYPDVISGSSWIQATEFTKRGPVSRGVLTYSQSTNPASPHFDDMTRRFSAGEWVDLPFREKDVAAATLTKIRLFEGKLDCLQGGWKQFTNPAFANQGECVSYYEDLRRRRMEEIRDRH